jgi:SSS family solute:Na+ symporter
MSIAAANLWTRNIYKAFINPAATPKQEAQQSKLISLVVKFGALAFVLGLGTQEAINFQLLGGVWILQTMPALVFSLYTRWFHRNALLAGWAVGMIYGTWTAYMVPAVGKPGSHFGGPLQLIPFTDTKGYIALTAFAINVVVAVLLTFVFRAMKLPEGTDETSPSDYHADAGDRGVEDVLEGEPGTAPTTP